MIIMTLVGPGLKNIGLRGNKGKRKWEVSILLLASHTLPLHLKLRWVWVYRWTFLTGLISQIIRKLRNDIVGWELINPISEQSRNNYRLQFPNNQLFKRFFSTIFSLIPETAEIGISFRKVFRKIFRQCWYFCCGTNLNVAFRRL